MDAKTKLKLMLEARKNGQSKSANQEAQSQVSVIDENRSGQIQESVNMGIESGSLGIDSKKTDGNQVGDGSKKDIKESEATSLAEINKPLEVKETEDKSHPIFAMIDIMKEAMTKQLPNFHTALRDVHLHLAKDPDVMTILTEKEIGEIVSGLKKVQGDVQLSTSKSSTKKRMPVEADML